MYLIPNNTKKSSLFSIAFLYTIFFLLYLMYVKLLIKKCKISKKNITNKGAIIGAGSFTMAGILGITVGRHFLHQLEQIQVILFMIYCLVFLSMLTLLGAPSLLKYYYIKKYKNILEEDLKKPVQGKK